MSRYARARGSEGIHEVNMTPLIDVSLVLVVILMVATPMAFQSSIGVRQAARAARAADTPTRAEWIEVAVLGEDSLLVNRRPVARAALAASLRPLVEASATGQVLVRCADDVSHGTFVAVLDEAKQSGATQIAVTE